MRRRSSSKIDGPYEDLIRPHDWSFAGGGSGGAGITTLPHMGDLVVRGPIKTTGISTTASRQKVFSCRPTSAPNERVCAKQIIAKVGGEAYRRPVPPAEVDRLMPFYEAGAAKGGFETGVRSALEAILASPHFIFRLERAPTDARSGGTYRVADIDLASRLSFFIWGLPPDQDLIDAAGRRELSTLAGIEKHARRMLADPRATALADRFAAQWLRLQDVEKVHPDPNFYPNFDENLADAMRTETKMFFDSLVKEDRSLLELLTADYTFVNERLARHYGFQGVVGNEFRRVTYPDTSRRGILGQGTMLVQTSLANRTSPVLRGKWVMEVLLGTPPPPPPPDIPDLEAAGESKDGRLLTTREKMEIHRKNATCNSCHRFMDPIGLALDNFDVTAQVAPARERHAARHRRRLLRRHQGDLAAGADRGAGEAADAAGAHLHREPDGLRPWPPRRVLRPADHSRHREDGRRRQLQDFLVHPGRRQERRVPDAASGTRNDNDRNEG